MGQSILLPLFVIYLFFTVLHVRVFLGSERLIVFGMSVRVQACADIVQFFGIPIMLRN
jgi:hypothetical protein